MIKIKEKNPKLNFIKNFSKLSVKSICNELSIDPSNLYRGNTSQKNIDLVYITIIKKMKILVDDVRFDEERCKNLEKVLNELEKYKKLYITTLAHSLNNSIKQNNKHNNDLEALNEGWKIELEKQDNYISKDKIKDIIHKLYNDIDYWRSDCLRDLEKLLK